VVVAGTLVLVGCDRLSAPSTSSVPASTLPAATGPAVTAATTTPSSSAALTSAPPAPTAAPAATTTVDPGTLPQTMDRPSGSEPAFVASMALLWSAIVDDAPDTAFASFFPQSAYRQVKAIAAPDRDYVGRLIANFRADVHADHLLLGAGAGRAQLVGVTVPDSQAVWVGLGVEQNKVRYWRVYGTVLRYRLDGSEATLPITSLISWRGRWYLVHLGPIR
jgi:hypothetical protein